MYGISTSNIIESNLNVVFVRVTGHQLKLKFRETRARSQNSIDSNVNLIWHILLIYRCEYMRILHTINDKCTQRLTRTYNFATLAAR